MKNLQWNRHESIMNNRVYIYSPDHPMKNAKGSVARSRLVCEKALGKLLPPKCVVHHVDENCRNDKNTNLVVCQDDTYHKLIHKRLRAFKACGHPEYEKCSRCNKWLNPSCFYRRTDNNKKSCAYCIECSSIRQRQKRNYKQMEELHQEGANQIIDGMNA